MTNERVFASRRWSAMPPSRQPPASLLASRDRAHAGPARVASARALPPLATAKQNFATTFSVFLFLFCCASCAAVHATCDPEPITPCLARRASIRGARARRLYAH